MSLIRAVEKFDFSRGNKFSTYASWAIMKNFARSIPEEKHRRERFVTGHEERVRRGPGQPHRRARDAWRRRSRRRTASIGCWSTSSRASGEIIRMRAGLDNHSKGMTLEEIGQQFGITKERVRQLNVRAMKKLRSLAEEAGEG